MNCDLWRSHCRIFFFHWTCLYFSLCLRVVVLCPVFVNQKLKPKKPSKTRNIFLSLKNLV